MSITIVADPIITAADAQVFFGIADEPRIALLVNRLSESFKQFTGRVALSLQTGDITEYIRGTGTRSLHLHASPIAVDTGDEITATIMEGPTTIATYTYTGGDLVQYSTDQYGRLEIVNGVWPDQTEGQMVRVVYRGGWSTIPGDVVMGAIMQGKVDLRRLEGEVGMPSHGREGESTQFDTRGIIKTVQDLWNPYRIAD